MRAAGLKWIIGFSLFLMGTVEGFAQPLSPHTDSIEAMVANADYVVIATLTSFRRSEQGYDRDGHEATIAIEEAVKQYLNDEPQRGLSLHIPRPASVLADWKERACRLLIAIHSYAPQETIVIELVPETLEVMTADITLIRDPEVAIRLARAATTRLPANVKRVHTFDLEAPRQIVAGTRWEHYYDTGGHLRLSVPVDQHLEKRALDYIRSENAERRGEGARALAYFKSDKNLQIVKSLLDDPAVTYSQPADGDRAGERVYGVRHAAYQTRKAWRIDVKQPVVREEVR